MTRGIAVDKEVAAELKALRRVKKEYERLKLEHELLKKPSRSLPKQERQLRLHPASAGEIPGEGSVPAARCQCQWLLCVAGSCCQ